MTGEIPRTGRRKIDRVEQKQSIDGGFPPNDGGFLTIEPDVSPQFSKPPPCIAHATRIDGLIKGLYCDSIIAIVKTTLCGSTEHTVISELTFLLSDAIATGSAYRLLYN